jgi:hypothetical protein
MARQLKEATRLPLELRRRSNRLVGALGVEIWPPDFRQGGLSDTAQAKHIRQWSGAECRILGRHYFTAFYRLEVSMDIQNKLTRSIAVTAGIAATGLAVGAASMGALAIGALAIGALAVRKVAIRGCRVEKLSVGELTVDRLLIKDSVNRE